MTRTKFAEQFDVTGRHLCLLDKYLDFLERWNSKINLVGASTLRDPWTRHFADSAQLLELVGGDSGRWIDMGSGAGFPGVVVSILRGDAWAVELVESDQRKCAFLASVKRELGISCTVHNARIGELAVSGADVVSARALGSLDNILEPFSRFAAEHGVGLFPKGASWKEELAQAREKWDFPMEAIASVTDSSGAVIRVRNSRHAI